MMNYALFFTKKVISSFLYPLGTAVILCAIGLLMLGRTNRLKSARAVITFGLLWLVIMAMPYTAAILITPLERSAGPYSSAQDLAAKEVKRIVVLGGDVRPGNLTTTDRVACSSLTRVLEGVRLWEGLPAATLVLSGGRVSTDIPTSAEAMAAMAEKLGVPRSAMFLEDKSLDTRDEAVFLKPLLGTEAFALVTSASHMPRSMRTFQSVGLRPIAAPCDFEGRIQDFTLRLFIPGAYALMLSHKAFHEYLGLLALRIR